VESTVIDLTYEQPTQQDKIIKLEIKDILNINFSVAFYDTMFCLLNNISLEKEQYQQILQSHISQCTQPGCSRDKRSKRTNQEKKDNLYNLSNYFIKNATGEILLFKTVSQKTFQEIQPDEEYPIDFQINQLVTELDLQLKAQTSMSQMATQKRMSLY
jgi:hypothetical protein